MNDLRTLLYTPTQVREIDARAISALDISGLELMERAGAAAYRTVRRRWPSAQRLCVVCGIGNNAGDGYIVARLAHADGLTVEVLQLGDPARLRGDALAAAKRYREAGGAVRPFAPDALAAADLLVDAIVGTGLDRPLADQWAAAVAAINALGKPVLGIDIPSGLHGATGAVLGTAVTATATVTFIAYKSGLFTGAGPAVVGELELAGLGVPAAAFDAVPPHARLIGPARVPAVLPRRQRDAHKGRYGHALVVGGDYGMGGAARMAAEAAARVGAGLVTVATRAEHCAGLLAARPELMCRAIAAGRELQPLLERASVVVLGPGLGRDSWGRELFHAALEFDGAMLIDADGLNLLAEHPHRNDGWVLTPHPGEAARLLATGTTDIQQDRYTAAERLTARYGGVVVLKGAGTVVAGDGALPEVCSTGNPGMASGGMGDVLSGVIGGLLAQGLAAPEAAAVGVHLHGLAADRAAVAGERGLLALDLMPHLRELVNP
jgi:hydroxyethylthiazole kinase-like uncharacterized protein yjeF